PFRDAGGARRERARRALDADDAHAATPVGIELVVVAKRRDEDPVPRGRVDEELALGRAHLLSVEREADHCALMLMASPSGAKVSGQCRKAFRIGNGAPWPRPQIEVPAIASSHSSTCARGMAICPRSS